MRRRIPYKRRKTKSNRKSQKWENVWKAEDNPLNDGKFDLEKLRLDIVSLIRKKVAKYDSEDKWHTSTDKERIQILLEKRKRKRKEGKIYNGLNQYLSFVLKSVLERVYTKYFGKRKMSKNTRVIELVAGFFDEESPLDKREEEETNIQAIGNIDEEFQFFELCGIVLPREIPNLIFEFIERNYHTLTTIGLTCQYFYISLLFTWNEIKVNRKNLFKISLLALKRVRKLRIESITQVEQEYLWKHVTNTRLRELKIKNYGQVTYVRSVLSVLQKIKKKRSTNPTNYPVQNVTQLDLGTLYRGRASPFSSVYSDLFPNLTKVSGGCSVELSAKMFERSPKIKTLGIVGAEIDSTYRLSELLHKLWKYVDPKQIKRLNISNSKVNVSRALKHVKKTTHFFTRLESFSLCTTSRVYRWGNYKPDEEEKLDLSTLFSLLENPIRNITIDEKVLRNCLIGRGDNARLMRANHQETIDLNNSIHVIYSNDIRVENLEIYSFQRGYTYLNILDFNLEEMLSTNFLLNPHLKSFKGDVSLGKRSRNLRLVEKEEGKEENDDNDNNNNNGDNNSLNRRKKACLEDELIKVVEVGQSFCRFLRDSMVSEFRKFEVIVRSYDTFFKDEFISIQYDETGSVGVKRLRVGYSAGYCYRGNLLPFKLDHHELDRTFSDNRELSRVFLKKRRKPCLMIFHEIIEVVMEEMSGQIDLFCFEVQKDKVCRNAWKCYFLDLIQQKEEVGESFLEDFVFNEEELVFTRKLLL